MQLGSDTGSLSATSWTAIPGVSTTFTSTSTTGKLTVERVTGSGVVSGSGSFFTRITVVDPDSVAVSSFQNAAGICVTVNKTGTWTIRFDYQVSGTLVAAIRPATNPTTEGAAIVAQYAP